MSEEYILCDNTTRLAEAIKVLKSSPHVVLDCEGDNLGERGGSMSIISCRASGQTLLVDTKAMSKEDLAPLFNILESPSPSKIMFDGRMDFSELFHGFGIHLKGVLDLQIADVESRALRGEDEDDQLKRLSPYIHHGEIRGQRSSYKQIHKLLGLEACLKEHGIDEKKSHHDHSAWLVRPIVPNLLIYATQDLILIEKLYEHFDDKGYMGSALLEQSQRYVEIWMSKRPPLGSGHPLLPLGILTSPSLYSDLCCKNCGRNLPTDCFSKAAQRVAANRNCWVCRAIQARGNRIRQWEDWNV